ncbi:hypothetical protein [Helicobacter bilis]|uniref:hypothetical protein n=1 Tax=Helicobacter bilis TaxID=37372 RepID=UPI0026EE8113|nr:hypothetical protein [Helicobacter bilis]MCI7410130.1 hypothetical protein [Helicobacter bilis]MDD7296183.1 hypothetical protein [Helicobacter bilis]MDY4401038.1 hypothetical protein [Helicobacter bilis]
MRLFHLYIFDKIKPLVLQKIIANILGFIIIYPIALHNKETALLLSLFLAVYLYKNMQNLDSMSYRQGAGFEMQDNGDLDSKTTCHVERSETSKNLESNPNGWVQGVGVQNCKILESNPTNKSSNTQDSINTNQAKPLIPHDFAIIQLMISLFCACLFVFATWQMYILEAFIGCIFIRIYDYYKPSLIGRFYNLKPNKILGSILGAILHGVLSGASVMILYYISVKFS